MQTSVNRFSAGLAVAGAGILTLGLVTAPAGVDAAVAPSEFRAVRLAAVTASEISNVVIGIAPTVAAAVVPPSLGSAAAAAAAAASAAANSADATTSTAAATASASVPASVMDTLTSIVTRLAWISADVAIGGAYLVIGPAIWFVLTPVTFPFTGLGTVLTGCQVSNCFSQAALNFFTIPFVPAGFALNQAVAQAQALVQDLTTLFTGIFGGAAATSTATATAAATSSARTASVADTSSADPSSTNPPNYSTGTGAGLRARSSAAVRAAATAAVTPKSVAAGAVDAGSAPGADVAISGTDTTSAATPATKSVNAGITAKKDATDAPGSHGVGGSRRN